MGMNLNNARYILTIVEEGSISRAAQRLYVTQPALSQTVRQVERGLGAELFFREGGQQKLTYAGERYMQVAQQMLMLERNLQDEIEEINHERCGLLRFGISTQLGIMVLPEILPAYQKLYPQVKLQIEVKGSAALERMVAEGNLDISLASTFAQNSILNYHLVQKEQIGILSGKDSSLSRQFPNGTSIDIMQALEEPFVFLTEGHSARSIQDHILTMRKVRLHKMLEVDSFEIAKRVSIRCGAALIAPYSLLRNDVDVTLQKANFYPLQGVQNPRDTFLIHHQDRYLPQYMQGWVRLIEALYQTEEAPTPSLIES